MPELEAGTCLFEVNARIDPYETMGVDDFQFAPCVVRRFLQIERLSVPNIHAALGR